MIPESELVRNSLTIRFLDLPPDVKHTRKSLLRWFCLSFGLLSENESRQTILDVLDALFFFYYGKKIPPDSNQLLNYINTNKKSKKLSSKLLRYHLKKLSDLGLIERKNLKYYFKSSPYAQKFDAKESFKYWVSNLVNDRLKDIEAVFDKLALIYSSK